MTSVAENRPHLPTKVLLVSTKAFFTPSRTLDYLLAILDDKRGVLPALQSVGRDQLLFALIPDFLTIIPCANILNSHVGHLAFGKIDPAPDEWPICLGAQDCFWNSYGAYTGEIVPEALRAVGVRIVELGHSERRRLLAETDQTTARKAAAVAAAGMIPLVCIGELERPAELNLGGPMSMAVGNAMRELEAQVTSLLEAVPPDAPVIFAYEPVWAIGAEEPASVDYVGPVVHAIREIVKSSSAKRTAETKVVYGGSAGPGLWSGKINGGNGLNEWVDGMFLGRFAHEISGVKEVVDEVVESLKNM